MKEIRKRKRILSIILAVCMVAGIVLAPAGKREVRAATSPDGNFQYEVGTDGTSVAITKYIGTDTKITVPAEIDGKKVSVIGATAFMYNPLTEIEIPNSVTDILSLAFNGCNNLQKVTIPDSVTFMGVEVFQECSSLTKITIPDSIDKLYERVFKDCTSLTEITIPSSVQVMSGYTFMGCTNLKKVNYSGTKEQWDKITNLDEEEGLLSATIYFRDGTVRNPSEDDYLSSPLTADTIKITGYKGTSKVLSIPSTIGGKKVTQIGGYAFNGHKGITEVSIPDTVTAIGQCAFSESSVETVTVPASVTEIGLHAFKDCENLANINVDPTNKHFSSDNGVLYNNSKTVLISYPAGKKGSYDIPSGVTNIGDYAFFDCSGLTGITIPNTVVSIQEAALEGCSGLTGITIPSSVRDIGAGALKDCSGLTGITIPSSVMSLGASAFSHCTGLKTATVQFSVSRIGDEVFSNCTSLESITVPSSVAEIGGKAFEGCSRLKSVTLPTSVTSIQANAFADCSSLNDVHYDGSEEQWNTINISTGNQSLLNATIHLGNGTTINGPEKNADYKIGTISGFNQSGKTVRISGNTFSVADSFSFSGLSEMQSSQEQIISTFQNGKVIKIESIKDVLRAEVSITENGNPITLQSNGYKEDCQDISVALELTSNYPESAFRGAADIGMDASGITVSVDKEGFCISHSRTERDEEATSITETIKGKLEFGKPLEYKYVIYAKNGFTFSEEKLPYTVNVSADTENGKVSTSSTMYAIFRYTQQEINVASAQEELDRLKTGDPLSLRKEMENYLFPEQIDVLESYLFTWLAEINYAYKYQGSSEVKKLIMEKAGLDTEANLTSGNEKAVTHITVDTKFGEKKNIEVTLDLGKPDSQGNLYPAYGAMHYELLEKNGIPESVPTEGRIGKSSYADMGPFVRSVADADEASLKGTYQWGSLTDELTAGVLIDKAVVSIIGEEKGSFSDRTYTMFIKPIYAYNKRVTISCEAVDVSVYTMEGKKVGAIVNNAVKDAADDGLSRKTKARAKAQGQGVEMYVDGAVKTIYFTGDDYYVNLRGTDTGTMNYVVEELVDEKTQRTVQFLELILKEDMEYEGYVFRPLNIDSDLYALRTKDGSQVFYADKDSYEALFKRILNMTLSQQSSSLKANKTVQLNASLTPLDASNPNLIWTTDNGSVAKVNSNGLVTAVGAGRTMITAETKDGSFIKQFCIIDVENDRPGTSGSSAGSSGGWSGGGYAAPVEQVATPVVAKLHYVLQFNVNGGTNLSRKTMTLLENDSPGIMPKAQRKDYTFNGWYTGQDGGTKVTGNEPLKEAATLYARWTKTAAPAKTASLTLKSSKKGQLKASFQKVSGASGYQVEYSASKDFKSAKTKEAGAAAKSKTVTGLTAGKKYYVRVRAYALDSMKNRVYGAYSAVKSVSVKK